MIKTPPDGNTESNMILTYFSKIYNNIGSREWPNISPECLLLCLIKDKIREIKISPHRKVNIETKKPFVIV